MTDLATGSISYLGEPRLTFGPGTPRTITGFARGVAPMRTGDRDRVGQDGRNMGRDLKGAPTHTLSLLVAGDGETPAERQAHVRQLLGELASVWSADALRARSGELAALRIGDRIAYGRPRDFTPDDETLWDGTSEPALAFDAIDDRWYGPEVSIRFGLTPEFTGGLKIPAKVPFVLGGGTGNANRVITFDGDDAVFPIFELHGPIKDAYIEVVGVGRLQLRGQVAYDQTLTLDCRPPRGIFLNGNAFPGGLHPAGARLSDMQLRPGAHSVLFGGYDPTGTSRLAVRVEPAFKTL